MKTTCTAANLRCISSAGLYRGLRSCFSSNRDTHAAVEANISAGLTAVSSASVVEKTKDKPMAVKILARRLWIEYKTMMAREGMMVEKMIARALEEAR